jgi:hypothetical protein
MDITRSRKFGSHIRKKRPQPQSSKNQGGPWERKAERTTVEPGGRPDVFAARTRDPPPLLLRDDLKPTAPRAYWHAVLNRD